MSSNHESFSKLKKDLLFHEKRMQLLLATRIVEDLGSNLNEKTLSRQECASDCRCAIEKFEIGAAEGRLSGRWDELRVATLFGLEVPLNMVVGSSKFEKPPQNLADLSQLVEQMEKLAKRFPEFAATDPTKQHFQVGQFVNAVKTVQWTPRDMSRMKEAISAKLAVLSELDELAVALEDSAYSISLEQGRIEELRRIEEKAKEEGEMAVSDGSLREKLKAMEKVIDLYFFQSHTIDSTIDSNVTKRRSNLTGFQGGAAMIDCLRKEKQGVVESCKKDEMRIRRGLDYEDKAKGENRRKVKQSLDDSMSVLKELDRRQERLSTRLQELYRDFAETEAALEHVGIERAKAIAAHVELVENSRHTTSEFIEMTKFAEIYAENLKQTVSQYSRGIGALDSLENLLLQQQSFDQYDFNASARRLSTMQRRVCIDLNRALNDYETVAAELLRRLTAQQKVVDDQLDQTNCELEVRKEMFDPSTKKYVLKLRALTEERAKIDADCQRLRAMVDRQRTVCMEKIASQLGMEEFVDVDDKNLTQTLSRNEELLDMRQELITPQELGIVRERVQVARERQSTGTSTTATRKSQSKVLGIRNDVKDAARVLENAEQQQLKENTEALSGEEDRIEERVAKDSSGESPGSRLTRQAIEYEEHCMAYRPKARVIGPTQ